MCACIELNPSTTYFLLGDHTSPLRPLSVSALKFWAIVKLKSNPSYASPQVGNCLSFPGAKLDMYSQLQWLYSTIRAAVLWKVKINYEFKH